MITPAHILYQRIYSNTHHFSKNDTKSVNVVSCFSAGTVLYSTGCLRTGQINFSRSLTVQPGSFTASETASSSDIPMYLENSDTDIEVYARLISSNDLSRTIAEITINNAISINNRTDQY